MTAYLELLDLRLHGTALGFDTLQSGIDAFMLLLECCQLLLLGPAVANTSSLVEEPPIPLEELPNPFSWILSSEIPSSRIAMPQLAQRAGEETSIWVFLRAH